MPKELLIEQIFFLLVSFLFELSYQIFVYFLTTFNNIFFSFRFNPKINIVKIQTSISIATLIIKTFQLSTNIILFRNIYTKKEIKELTSIIGKIVFKMNCDIFILTKLLRKNNLMIRDKIPMEIIT